MRRLLASILALLVAASLVVGCSQGATPAPTQAPSKVAEPAKPAASAPTAAPAAAPAPTKAPEPARKVDFPQAGKYFSLILPWSAGGSTDVQARLLLPVLEKELGAKVEIFAKPGAGSQIGLTELAQAKPDGYTFGFTNNPTTIGVYMNPDRKTVFNRTSFQPVANFIYDVELITVRADAPYKTVKDLVDAAKAKPKTIRATTNGLMSDDHLAIIDSANDQEYPG